eukprot:g1217.t1
MPPTDPEACDGVSVMMGGEMVVVSAPELMRLATDVTFTLFLTEDNGSGEGEGVTLAQARARVEQYRTAIAALLAPEGVREEQVHVVTSRSAAAVTTLVAETAAQTAALAAAQQTVAAMTAAQTVVAQAAFAQAATSASGGRRRLEDEGDDPCLADPASCGMTELVCTGDLDLCNVCPVSLARNLCCGDHIINTHAKCLECVNTAITVLQATGGVTCNPVAYTEAPTATPTDAPTAAELSLPELGSAVVDETVRVDRQVPYQPPSLAPTAAPTATSSSSGGGASSMVSEPAASESSGTKQMIWFLYVMIAACVIGGVVYALHWALHGRAIAAAAEQTKATGALPTTAWGAIADTIDGSGGGGGGGGGAGADKYAAAAAAGGMGVVGAGGRERAGDGEVEVSMVGGSSGLGAVVAHMASFGTIIADMIVAPTNKDPGTPMSTAIDYSVTPAKGQDGDRGGDRSGSEQEHWQAEGLEAGLTNAHGGSDGESDGDGDSSWLSTVALEDGELTVVASGGDSVGSVLADEGESTLVLKDPFNGLDEDLHTAPEDLTWISIDTTSSVGGGGGGGVGAEQRMLISGIASSSMMIARRDMPPGQQVEQAALSAGGDTGEYVLAADEV